MRRGHRAGRVEVHDRRAANDRRKGHPAGDPLAAADQVGHHAVVFEAPVRARPAKSGLDFVEDQRHLVLVAPRPQPLDVFGWRETGIASLVGFAHHAGDAIGREALRLERIEKDVEARVRAAAKTVREGHLDHVLVKVHDPLLQGRYAAGHLGPHRAAVEGVVEGHDADLLPPADPRPFGSGQLDRALGRLGAGGQQEHLVEPLRCDFRQFCRQAGALTARKAVVVDQPAIDLFEHRAGNLGVVVAGVGDQHAARPVEPPVAPAVENLATLGPIPDHQRLAAHRPGFVLAKLLENRDRLGNGDRSVNATVLRFNRRHLSGRQGLRSGFRHRDSLPRYGYTALPVGQGAMTITFGVPRAGVPPRMPGGHGAISKASRAGRESNENTPSQGRRRYFGGPTPVGVLIFEPTVPLRMPASPITFSSRREHCLACAGIIAFWPRTRKRLPCKFASRCPEYGFARPPAETPSERRETDLPWPINHA